MNKNFKNNRIWGIVTIILNGLILSFFAFALSFLMKFDKVNIDFVDIKPIYEEKTIAMYEARQPMRQDSAAVAYYSKRVDSLQKMTPTNAAERKVVTAELKRVSEILTSEIAKKERTDSIVNATEVEYEPIRTQYEDIQKDVSAKYTFFKNLIFVIALFFLLKVLTFAFWSYRNSKNLHGIASWMKDGHAPYWTFLSWFIPIYNLIKPFNVTNELMNETEYILTEKEILPKQKYDNTEFLLGLWWAFLLVAVVICSFILNATFFSEGPMFWKLSHLSMAISTFIIWVIYLALEVLVILKYNKYNKLFIENASKF